MAGLSIGLVDRVADMVSSRSVLVNVPGSGNVARYAAAYERYRTVVAATLAMSS